MVQIAPTTPSGIAAGRDVDARQVFAPAVRKPPIWRELLLIVLFYSAYMGIRILINKPSGSEEAFRHARQIFSWEKATGLDIELGLNEHLLKYEWLAVAFNLFYLSAHFIVTIGVVIWLYRSRPGQYAWLRAGILIATGLALIGFWQYPLAPPRFMPSFGFIDPVVFFDTPGLYSSGASTTMANQYAAMPSMHAGWAVWCGIALFLLGRRWWVKAFGIAYPLTTVVVIMATANHFILDAAVGVALILLGLAVSWAAYRQLAKRSAAAQ